mmetsp:Transcript_16328/g.25358  ORF Transcript_16328/g.25358 Transcript_16328/m.25358 type:complete len:157 (+) Transcript_16328:2411-2881(+)
MNSKYSNTYFVNKIKHVSEENCNQNLEKARCVCKVQRLDANSISKDSNLSLDVNTQIYPLSEGDKIELVILPLDLDYKLNYVDFKKLSSFEFEKNLFESYEYITFGTIFHLGIEKGAFFFYASFGGLLLKFFSRNKDVFFEQLVNNGEIFLFIRKI